MGLPIQRASLPEIHSLSGLATFQTLRASIAENELPNLDEENKTWLLEELDDCITKLKDLSERGGQFNLPVIM